jgi:hypothetical protein
MTKDEILEKLKKIKSKNTEKLESSQNEFLFAALALLGAAYSQMRNQGIEMEAAEFWPFGEFKPNSDPKVTGILR